MIIHPDVLAAHAEFGGDIESMQKLYEYPDLKAEVERLRSTVAQPPATVREMWRDKWHPQYKSLAHAISAASQDLIVSADMVRNKTVGKRLQEHAHLLGYIAYDLAKPPTPSDRSGVTSPSLIDAARDVIASASDSYKKRNGHLASFEDDSGEKCWIVPFDAFEGLRAALTASEGQP